MEEIKEPSFWERLKNRIFGGVSALFSLLGIGYFCSAMLMGNYYACTDKENSSYQYSLFQGAIWPYHVFINPEWKKDWDYKTYQLGFITMYAGNEEVALDIKKQSIELKEWVDDLPKGKKEELEKAAIAFGQFNIEWSKRNLENGMRLKGYKVKIDGQLKEYANNFSKVPEFKNAFDEMLKAQKPKLRVGYNKFAQKIRKLSPRPPVIDQETGLPIATADGIQSLTEIIESDEYQEFIEDFLPVFFAARQSQRAEINIVLEDIFEKPDLLPPLVESPKDNAPTTAESKSITKKDVVGIYERKFLRSSARYIFHENEKVEWKSGDFSLVSRWKIVGNEVHLSHLISGDSFWPVKVFRIYPNGVLSGIGEIERGKRKEFPKREQETYKKLDGKLAKLPPLPVQEKKCLKCKNIIKFPEGDPCPPCPKCGFDFEAAVNAQRMFSLRISSARQGDAEAQHELGQMLANPVESYAWFSISARNGNDEAVKAKRSVAKKMTPEQISKAEALAKEMIEKNADLIKKEE